MEDIRIYHKLAPTLNLLFVSLVSVTVGILGISKGIRPIAGWLVICFFGLGVLITLYHLLRERVFGYPYVVITDNGVVQYAGKSFAVHFKDVEKFSMTAMGAKKLNMISIHYKEDVELEHYDASGVIGRGLRKFNTLTTGAQEQIEVSDLTMKPEDICDLLNERLRQYNASKKVKK